MDQKHDDQLESRFPDFHLLFSLGLLDIFQETTTGKGFAGKSDRIPGGYTHAWSILV
jgi:hypothetical protein